MRRNSSTGNKQPGVSRSAQLIMHSYFYHLLLQLNSTLLFQMWLQTFSLGLHNKELCLLTDVISCAGDKTNTQRWNPSDLITTQTTVPSHRPLKRTICLWRVTTLPWIGVWKGGAARLVACCSSSGYLVAVGCFFLIWLQASTFVASIILSGCLKRISRCVIVSPLVLSNKCLIGMWRGKESVRVIQRKNTRREKVKEFDKVWQPWFAVSVTRYFNFFKSNIEKRWRPEMLDINLWIKRMTCFKSRPHVIIVSSHFYMLKVKMLLKKIRPDFKPLLPSRCILGTDTFLNMPY